MTNIREFHTNTSKLLEQYQNILIDYPTISSKLLDAKMSPLVFLAAHFACDDDLDGVIGKLLPDARVVLTKFWESAYRDEIFFTLAEDRQRHDLTSLKIREPFERVITFSCGERTICEEETYKYYSALFQVENGIDWFPVWICGLLIVAQDELISDINAHGDPLAPYVYEAIEKVLNPLLEILDYEKRAITKSERHKLNSVPKNPRGVKPDYQELKDNFEEIYQRRSKQNMDVSYKAMIRALEKDEEIYQNVRTGKYFIKKSEMPVTEAAIKSWLTACNKKRKL